MLRSPAQRKATFARIRQLTRRGTNTALGLAVSIPTLRAGRSMGVSLGRTLAKLLVTRLEASGSKSLATVLRIGLPFAGGAVGVEAARRGLRMAGVRIGQQDRKRRQKRRAARAVVTSTWERRRKL